VDERLARTVLRASSGMHCLLNQRTRCGFAGGADRHKCGFPFCCTFNLHHGSSLQKRASSNVQPATQSAGELVPRQGLRERGGSFSLIGGALDRKRRMSSRERQGPSSLF